MSESIGASRPHVIPWLVVVMGTLYVAIGGVVAVLLPAQVERIDPQGKVGALAVVTSIAFAVTLLAQPLIGAASDRTLSRFRGRAPWMLGSVLVGATAVALMGWTGSIAALCLLWTIGLFALNGVDITVSSALVDEFPKGLRGRPSGALASALAAGTALGAVIAGLLAGSPAVAFLIVATVAVMGAVAFFFGQRATTLSVLPTTRESARQPSRDFLWVIVARFAFTFGQQAVSTYLLYILADHIGVPTDSAPLLVSALTATGLVGLLLAAGITGRWSDRIGKRRTLLVAASAVFAAGMLLPIFAPVLPVMFVYAFLQGVGLGMHLAVGGALISEVLPGGDRRPGRELGLANTVVNAAQAAAPLVAGGIVVATGGYVGLFVFAMLAAALSAAAAWRVRGVD